MNTDNKETVKESTLTEKFPEDVVSNPGSDLKHRQLTKRMQSNRHVDHARNDKRKHSKYHNDNSSENSLDDTISEGETDIPSFDLNQKLSSNPPKKIKTRQSFSMETKLTWVREYQTCPHGTTMKKWLAMKNKAIGTRVSYASFRRWVTNFYSMINEESEAYFPYQSKNNFIRPHHEMEKVLVKFIRVRNRRLHASGKQPSSAEYIRSKAKEFYKEMYGNSNEFKGSNGWLTRFRDYYGELLDSERSEGQQKAIPVHQAHTKEHESAPSSDIPLGTGNLMAAYLKKEMFLTENKIKLLQQLMIAHSNSQQNDLYQLG